MQRFLRFVSGRLKPGHCAAGISVAALAALCFLCGAAVMYFEFFSSRTLRHTFRGIEQWLASDEAAGEEGRTPPAPEILVHSPGEVCAGYTLITTSLGQHASLIDLQGKVVHRWEMTDVRPWPRAPKVANPSEHTPVHWQRCRVFPNGDLLALCIGGDAPYGYGLARLDKDSHLLWAYPGKVHHDFDVGDDGRIYILAHCQGDRQPPGWPWTVPTPFIEDTLLVLSAEGKLLDSFSIVDAFRRSPYLLIAGPAEESAEAQKPAHANRKGGRGRGDPAPSHHDLLHANSVRVLNPALAGKFPMFKAGQVLVSLRTPSALAVLDIPSRTVIWATRGPWRSQHDAQFLPNGRLALFDNFGAGSKSRVLEYDPSTQAMPWWCGGENEVPFYSQFRGTLQRLPNGNTLIASADERRVLEVTSDKRLVWQWFLPATAASAQRHFGRGQPQIDEAVVTGAWRYSADEVPFLKRPSPDI